MGAKAWEASLTMMKQCRQVQRRPLHQIGHHKPVQVLCPIFVMPESTSQQTTFGQRLANLALKSNDGLMKKKLTQKRGGRRWRHAKKRG